jgi:hypothetical protein
MSLSIDRLTFCVNINRKNSIAVLIGLGPVAKADQKIHALQQWLAIRAPV